jgi:hypothetical protein
MTWRAILSFVVAPAAVALAAALGLGAVVASGGDDAKAMRPAVLAGDDLLRIFQEGKDAEEQVDPPEISLGTAFDPAQPQPASSDYR